MLLKQAHGAALSVGDYELYLTVAGDATYHAVPGDYGIKLDMIEARGRWDEIGGDESEWYEAVSYVDSLR